MRYFQDMLEGNHCFGCGPFNKSGLNIKSRWANETEAICHFNAQSHHCAAPTKFLNGGIIATIIDCHSICTAIAYAYKLDGREFGEGDNIWYATSNIDISYQRPVAIDTQITLRASVSGVFDRKLEVTCTLESSGKECAKAVVVAAAVPSSWML